VTNDNVEEALGFCTRDRRLFEWHHHKRIGRNRMAISIIPRPTKVISKPYSSLNREMPVLGIGPSLSLAAGFGSKANAVGPVSRLTGEVVAFEPASSSVPSGAAAGSGQSTLSPVRPRSIRSRNLDGSELDAISYTLIKAEQRTGDRDP